MKNKIIWPLDQWRFVAPVGVVTLADGIDVLIETVPQAAQAGRGTTGIKWLIETQSRPDVLVTSVPEKGYLGVNHRGASFGLMADLENNLVPWVEMWGSTRPDPHHPFRQKGWICQVKKAGSTQWVNEPVWKEEVWKIDVWAGVEEVWDTPWEDLVLEKFHPLTGEPYGDEPGEWVDSN